MRISQLEYLLAVEKAGSISLAASQLFVTQSLISYSIKNLEDELGQPLFTRSNKGIKLTSFGKEFLPFARSVIIQINQMKSLGKTGTTPYTSFSICNNNFKFAVELLANLYNKHKDENINVIIKDCSRQESIELVSSHMAELAVVRLWSFQLATMTKQLKSKNVIFCPCTILPTAVIVGSRNPYYSYPDRSIPPEALKNFPAIVYDFTLYNPNVTIQEQIPELEPSRFISVSSRSTVTEILQQTDAYYICATSSFPEERIIENYANCRILEIEKCPHTAQIGYIKHKDTNFSPLAQEYVELLTDFLQSW